MTLTSPFAVAPTTGHVRYVAVVPAWAGRPVASRAVYLRRRVMVGLVLFVAVLTAWLALAGPRAGNASGRGPSSPAAGAPARTVVAQPGDTLWSIAARHAGDRSTAAYADALVAANGGTRIDAGQQIVLP
jgi:hypothetical protein